MDPYFRCDHAYIENRRQAGTYQLGDERPKHVACALCTKKFLAKRGTIRDMEDQMVLIRCKACIEREERYRDYLAQKKV